MKRVYGTNGTSVLLGDDVADRVQWVSNEFKARGKSFSVTDGYRPDGVEADYWVDNPSETSTGGFNQWYAIGQHRRRGGAYAAPVGSSDHAKTGPGQGAIDCSVQDMALRHELMGVVGMIQTDPTESWHFSIRRSPASWWNRAAVTYPGQTVAPTKPASDTSKRKKESIMPLIYQENDTKDGKTFIMDGGAVWINPDELKSAIALNVAAGLTGPGFSEPAPVSWVHITRVSDALRRATQVKEVRDDIKNISKS